MVVKRVNNLNTRKKSSGEIPANILKQYVEYFKDNLTDSINNCINNGVFPNELKRADITPCFKKEDPTNKENYRPISILPTLSKVLERILYDQVIEFIEPKLSKKLCGFRKGYSTTCFITSSQKMATIYK